MRPQPKHGRRIVDAAALVRKLARDGYECRVTGLTDEGNIIDPHHLVPRSQGGDDVEANIVPLNRRVHDALHHSNGDTRRRARVMVRRVMRQDEVAYVVGRKGQAWLDAQYPAE